MSENEIEEDIDPLDPNEDTNEDANARHVRLHAVTEPGELLPEPHRTEADSRFHIGDECWFQFPAVVRRHGEHLQHARTIGRILKIHAGIGELWYEVQARESGLSESLVDNPPFLLPASHVARLG